MTITPATHEPGTATSVPGLPPGFTETFTSLRVDTGSVRLLPRNRA